MSINIANIKTLRNNTGAGFADCKKALEDSNNNIDLATKQLKKMGIATAEKRSGRSTGEGSIFVNIQGNKAVLLELMCETDFVAKNEDFQKLGNILANDVLSQNPATGNFTPTKSMISKIQNLVAIIKENMKINRIFVIEKTDNEVFASYTHKIPARLGTVIALSSDSKNALETKEIKEFVFACALHAVARKPLFIDKEHIDSDYKTEQMSIINSQVAQMGKPEKIAVGIAQGKWNKHTTEICFTLQPWVHNDKSSAEQELSLISKNLGTKLAISNFVVFTLGEE